MATEKHKVYICTNDGCSGEAATERAFKIHQTKAGHTGMKISTRSAPAKTLRAQGVTNITGVKRSTPKKAAAKKTAKKAPARKSTARPKESNVVPIGAATGKGSKRSGKRAPKKTAARSRAAK